MSAFIAAVSLLLAPGYQPHGPRIGVEVGGHRRFIITTDPKGSPATTRSILKLVKSGFYNGQRFHRVLDWVVQWGDPQSKVLPKGDPRLGSHGSGHPLPFEDAGATFNRGVVGIASHGRKLGGDSQMFVLTKDAVYLNHDYAVLGKVTSGMNVVDRIKQGDTVVRMWVLSGPK